MRIDELKRTWLPRVAEFVADRQRDPDTHVAYLSSDAGAIAEELNRLEPDSLSGVLVAVDGGRVVGLLGAEHGDDPPRVWWHGPFAVTERREHIADALYARARGRLPAHVTQEELAGDVRARFLDAFAHRHGFVPEGPSALLVRPLADSVIARTPIDGVTARPPTPAERAAAADLHDRLFPTTHSIGVQAMREEPQRIVLVAVRDGSLLGYIAAEVEANGDAYLDFLGVAEAARGQGVGALLVAAACELLATAHNCPAVHLVVLPSNRAARRLYSRLGFAEERMLRPWRKGFTGG